MRTVFNPSEKIFNALSTSAANDINTLDIAADPVHFWVIRKLWLSHDASGATDFGNLPSSAELLIKFGAATEWQIQIHPGNGGTGSVEFENGPWEWDFSPGLTEYDKNEAVAITLGAMGTGIVSTICILYS